MSRGQSTVEFALIVPFVAALLALTLQGGLLISDQVNLQHYAYDAGQWAQANQATATPDTGTPGTITKHVYDLLCAPGKTPANISGTTPLTRFCTSSLQVTAIDQTTPSALNFDDHAQMAAAVKCPTRTQRWTFSISPSSLQTVDNSSSGGTLNYTVKVNTVTVPSPSPTVLVTPAPSPTPQVAPTLRLHATMTPTPVSAAVTLSPNYITPTGADTSTMSWTYSTRTKKGTYTLEVTATDQCGVVLKKTVQITVGPVTVVSPSPVTPVQWLDSVYPPNACASLSQTFTLSGGGFVPGVTVDVDGVAATTVTYISNKKIQATIASLTAGYHSFTVTYPDGTKTVLMGAVDIVAVCVTPSPPGTTPSPPCVSSASPNSGSSGGSNELVVHVTWREPIFIPVLSGGTIPLSATVYVFCT